MSSYDTTLFEILQLSGKTDSNLNDLIINIFRFITHLGDGVFLVALSLIALGWLIKKKQYLVGLHWTVYVVFSYLFSAGAKQIIGRERPDEIYHLIEASSPALPSGHALKSTIVYAGIYLLLKQYLTLSASQQKALRLILLLPIAIGLSRIFLGVHWPSDVILGWLFGGVIFIIFAKLIDRSSQNFIPLKPTL